jgi:membrane-bound ClpP family serine protease
MRRFLAVVLVLVLAAPALRADVVTLMSGESIEGLIRTEGADFVVIEVFADGTSTLRRIAQGDISSVAKKPYTPPAAKGATKTTKAPPAKDAAAPKTAAPAGKSAAGATKTKDAPKSGKTVAPAKGPTYFVIPLKGEVGKQVSSQPIKDAIAAGLQDENTILILEIDSPGGLITECEKIIDLMAEQKGRRTMALIKNAYSAAAIIALTCDEIYMLDGASIGAATAVTIEKPSKSSGSSAPRMVEAPEKIQSVWRATCRRAAEIGDHNPLFAEAMVDPDMQLKLVEKDGKKTVEQCAEAMPEDIASGKIVSARGRLLTLTAKEAVACGLAANTASQRADLETVAPGVVGWKPLSNRGEKLMAGFAEKLESVTKNYEKLADDMGKEWQGAIADDPTTKTYYVDKSNKFTADSRKSWQANSVNCYNHLVKCENLLERLALIGKDYPFLQKDAEFAEKFAAKIKDLREKIKREASRRGV